MKPRCPAPLALACLLATTPAVAEEPIDWQTVNRIRDEGFNRSQVMDTLEHMTDVIGPRLTGSPAGKAANDHARADDLKQASVIMASFLYHAAMRDERFPREPMPQEPPAEEEAEDDEEDDNTPRRMAPPGVRQ